VGVVGTVALGVVQGLTEFLPVSSSGHLTLLQMALGMSDTSEMIALDVAMHAATLAAVLAYFGRRWAALLVCRPALAVAVVVAGLPAVAAYLVAGAAVEYVAAHLWALGLAFVASGGFLAFAALRSARAAAPAGDGAAQVLAAGRRGVVDALAVGAAQAVALLPGVSRSGATMGAGLLRGLRPDAAFSFSFLAGAPLMLGAIVVRGRDVAALAAADAVALAAGAAAALATGLVALVVLSRVVAAGRLWYFGAYAACVGAACLFVAIAGGL